MPEIDPWPYCFATHLENNELKEKLNLGVRMLSNSGQFNQIYYKWFIKPAEQPTKVFAIIIFVLLAISTASLIIIFIIRRHIRKVTAKLTILNNELKASIQSINLAIKTSEITRWDYNCLTQKFSTYNNQEGITDFEL